MDAELRKRLEEAARDYAETAVVIQSDLREEYIKESMHDFRAGASFGYKEAIARAKEWLKKEIDGCEFTYGPSEVNAFIADFETDMNKLWEE